MRFTVDRLDHLVVTCKDVEQTASWYQRVLGMERGNLEPDNRTVLKFGGQKIALQPAEGSTGPQAAVTIPGSTDLCLVTAVGPEEVVTHLKQCGVSITLGPVARTGSLGTMTSVYCRDPDGNLIEISTYLEV